MSMLSYEASRPSRLTQASFSASVVLGEGRQRPIIGWPATSDFAVEQLALLVGRLYYGLEYFQRHYAPVVPENYFTLASEPGIPIRLKITSVSEPQLFIYDED